MLIKFLFFIFILSGNIFVLAAENPPVELVGKIKSLKLNSESADYISFDLTIELEFVNKSDQTIFLSNRKPWESSQDIAVSLEDLSDRNFIYSAGGGAANDISPKWGKYRQKLDQTVPPKKYFRAVLPNQAWRFEFETVIEITKIVGDGRGFTFMSLNRVDWSEIKSAPELWLKLKLKLWFSNIEAVNDRDENRFGKKLRKQWEKYGYLWLDDIESKPFLLDLKPALNKTRKF